MPETELDKPMIVNWALAELGLKPKFSIDEDTQLGGTVDIFWPRAEARCFGLHDWTFCRRTSQLTRQDATPQTGYAYGFDLPGDRLGEPLKVLSDPRCETPVREYRIEGKSLFADEAAVYAVCKVRLDPRDWDIQFADCFAVCLAGYLAIPMLQDIDMAAAKEKQAFGTASEGGTGGMFGRLIAQHRSGSPLGSNLLRNDPLTAGRSAEPWHGRW